MLLTRKLEIDAHILSKLLNIDQTNLHEWLDTTLNEFCEEQVIEERILIEHIKARFFDNIHKQIFCCIPTVLQKFLLDRGAGHVI